MKKIFSLAIAAVVALMIVACSGGSPKSKADDYMKKIQAAAEKEDLEEVTKLCKEFDTWYETLGDADKSSLKQYKEYTDMMIGLKEDLDNLEDSLGDWGLGEENAEESDDSVEVAANLYLNSIYNNLKAGNIDIVEDLVNQLDEWSDELSLEDSQKAEAVLDAFFEEHPDFAELLEDFSESED